MINWKPPGVIFDNCQSSRQAHREMLKIVRFQQIHYAIFITRQMISDYTHYVELKLTPIDQEQVQQNLAGLGIDRRYPTTQPMAPSKPTGRRTYV